MSIDLGTLIAKADEYKKVLGNTVDYRKEWVPTIKPRIVETLESILEQTGINGVIEQNDDIINLESIVLNLGRSASGISEKVENTDIKRAMIKSNGSLVYQQLFNGKIMVMLVPPHIEGYGQPHPPKPLEILRPHELTQPFIIRHVETFIKEIVAWEDYDDDQPTAKQAFNPIGFRQAVQSQEENA